MQPQGEQHFGELVAGAQRIDHQCASEPIGQRIARGTHAGAAEHDNLGTFGQSCPARFLHAVEQAGPAQGAQARSEEHTSELQSLMRISYAAFRRKKKQTYNMLPRASTEELTS